MKDYRLLSHSSSWMRTRPRKLLIAAASGLGAAMVLLAGCGPVKLVASTNIPAPLVVKIPIGVALFVPTEFSSYVHKEERWSTKWHVDLGKAQTDGITRLMNAMFERVIAVESVNAGTQVPGGVAAILEPSIEEYAFVTPRDAGSPFYAVSIKYRVNVYLPDGKLADSWGFTGYGTSPSQGLSSQAPLSTATALAMRDAGAKLAVEFREQAVMRGLLPGSASADVPPAPAETTSGETTSGETTPAAPGAAPAVPTPPAEGEPATPPTTQPENQVLAPEGATSAPAQPEAATETPTETPKEAPQDPPKDPPQDPAGATGEPAKENEEPAAAPPPQPEAFALTLPVS